MGDIRSLAPAAESAVQLMQVSGKLCTLITLTVKGATFVATANFKHLSNLMNTLMCFGLYRKVMVLHLNK